MTQKGASRLLTATPAVEKLLRALVVELKKECANGESPMIVLIPKARTDGTWYLDLSARTLDDTAIDDWMP